MSSRSRLESREKPRITASAATAEARPILVVLPDETPEIVDSAFELAFRPTSAASRIRPAR
ncbi:MAG TPA: hypothetical protein DCQ98_07450 [Planctomycetaceae bacterium]|nr:hypothetical protein [Planctomycetaceae bacterium]